MGPGCVLEDLIRCGRLPVVELDQVFRQAAASRIVANAHRIRLGLLPQRAPDDEETDFSFFEEEDPQRLCQLIVQLFTRRIPERWGLDPMEEVQVLTPVHGGTLGASNLNSLLQESLNPVAQELQWGRRRYRLGDRVIQLHNDYQRSVWNGDVGRIVAMDRRAGDLTVVFDGRPVNYARDDLEGLALAYALTVHKAQGSEYPAVIMPVVMAHYPLLQRPLLYTAVSRGRRLVFLAGSWRAVALAARTDHAAGRSSRLAERIRNDR